MPATHFICPDGNCIRIEDCLRSCPHCQRCMFLPTLRAVANSLDRQLSEPTVTELIAGTRETFLKKTTDYAVDPASVLYALHGQAVHSINERHTQGEILSEERLKDDITSGQFDLFGKILDADEGVLGDLKVTSSFKLMKALGIYKAKVDTGEVTNQASRRGNTSSVPNCVLMVFATFSIGRFNSITTASCSNAPVSTSTACSFKPSAVIRGFALPPSAVSPSPFTLFQSTE